MELSLFLRMPVATVYVSSISLAAIAENRTGN